MSVPSKFRAFTRCLADFAATDAVAPEKTIASLESLRAAKDDADTEAAALHAHYTTNYESPRSQYEADFAAFLSMREPLLNEYLKSRNVATLKDLVKMKPADHDVVPSIFTRYANPLHL